MVMEAVLLSAHLRLWVKDGASETTIDITILDGQLLYSERNLV